VHCSVAIIGGGVIGASAAWHLTQRGVRDVLVLDAASALGAGSTGRATGGFRTQFATAINVQLSLLSREKLLRFAADTGVDPGYREVGYLYLATDRTALETLTAAQQVQRAAGVSQVEIISQADAAARSPHANMDGVLGASWCPIDGTIRPLQILGGYHAAAMRGGATWWFDAPVTAIDRDASGAIRTLHTPRGTVQADQVINAAGAWAGTVAALAGIDLPVSPARRQVASSALQDRLPDSTPMTIWTDNAFHFRVRDGRVLCNWPVDDGVATDGAVSPAWLEDVTRLAHDRLPIMREIGFDAEHHWSGLYEMSPDKTVLFGVHPDCNNLLIANGSSGHGVMHSPILGQLLSELVCDGRASALDVHALRPARFAEGDALPLSGLL
jgi:sarcosine oxidase, subunit beta